MSAQSLSPWLADFIQEEINQVLAWQDNLKNGIKVENDHLENFPYKHDGSNFRSFISQPAPGKSEVQLIEVLSSPDATGVKVVVSDGHTQLKARLLGSAVDILEAELDEKLGKDTTNDVFRLKRFVVVFTAVGSETEWIQLTIEDIEYLYHRRRNLGQPTPVEQDSNIRPLITENVTSLLLSRAEAEAEEIEEDLLSQELQDDSASVAIPQSSPPQLPVSQPPQDNADGDSARKRRKPQHTLDGDGFEFQTGVNLEGPVKAQRRKEVDLLSLMRKDQPRPEIVAETPVKPSGQNGDIRGKGVFAERADNESQSVACSPESMELDVSPPRPVASHQTRGQSQAPRSGASQADAPHSNQRSEVLQTGSLRPSISRLSPERHGYPRPPSPVAVKKPSQPKVTRSTQAKSRVPYGRRKIPSNQRALLDKETSWLPSLPGRRFPKPNIPIELLTKWNEDISPSQNSVPASGCEQATPNRESRSSGATKGGVPQQEESSSESSSESSDGADKEVSESEWPASSPQAPPQPRPDLPPDSSLGDGDLFVEPPRPLERHKPTQRAMARPQATPRHPLPNRPAGPLPEHGDAVRSQHHSPSMIPFQRVQPQEQPSLRLQQYSREPSDVSSPADGRNDAARSGSSTFNRDSMSPGAQQSEPRASSSSSAHRNNAQTSASARSSFSTTLPGLNLSKQPVVGRHETPTRSSQPSSTRPNGTSHPGEHPSRTSHTTPRGPLPPREFGRQSKRAWQEGYRKQEERLKAQRELELANEMMREFVSSFINIRPGGAFATTDVAPLQRSHLVDVLAWKR